MFETFFFLFYTLLTSEGWGKGGLNTINSKQTNLRSFDNRIVQSLEYTDHINPYCLDICNNVFFFGNISCEHDIAYENQV